MPRSFGEGVERRAKGRCDVLIPNTSTWITAPVVYAYYDSRLNEFNKGLFIRNPSSTGGEERRGEESREHVMDESRRKCWYQLMNAMSVN